MVDTTGDGHEKLTYQFEFKTKVQNGSTFLYNTGKIGGPPNLADPSSQYTNLNIAQTFTLTEVQGNRRTGQKTVLLREARVAPINIGPKSVGTQAEYEKLADAAIHTVLGTTIPGKGGMRVFAGPRADGFFADLMGAFDLLNPRKPGVNYLKGYNVHTIALEVPKSRLAGTGSGGVIGVWASASRKRTTVLREDGRPADTSDRWVQVSRLGNPLVNEVRIPLRAKDLYNASEPANDGANFADYIVNPGKTQGGGSLVAVLNSVTTCTPLNDRADLQLALLTGIPGGTIPGFPGNSTGTTRADMLRLNYTIPPAATPNRLGLLGGDIAGFPNGRRIGDDVVDIELKAAAGAVLHVLGAIKCPVSLQLSDNVEGPDVPSLTRFPYLGTPHQGYDRKY